MGLSDVAALINATSAAQSRAIADVNNTAANTQRFYLELGSQVAKHSKNLMDFNASQRQASIDEQKNEYDHFKDRAVMMKGMADWAGKMKSEAQKRDAEIEANNLETMNRTKKVGGSQVMATNTSAMVDKFGVVRHVETFETDMQRSAIFWDEMIAGFDSKNPKAAMAAAMQWQMSVLDPSYLPRTIKARMTREMVKKATGVIDNDYDAALVAHNEDMRPGLDRENLPPTITGPENTQQIDRVAQIMYQAEDTMGGLMEAETVIGKIKDPNLQEFVLRKGLEQAQMRKQAELDVATQALDMSMLQGTLAVVQDGAQTVIGDVQHLTPQGVFQAIASSNATQKELYAGTDSRSVAEQQKNFAEMTMGMKTEGGADQFRSAALNAMSKVRVGYEPANPLERAVMDMIKKKVFNNVSDKDTALLAEIATNGIDNATLTTDKRYEGVRAMLKAATGYFREGFIQYQNELNKTAPAIYDNLPDEGFAKSWKHNSEKGKIRTSDGSVPYTNEVMIAAKVQDLVKSRYPAKIGEGGYVPPTTGTTAGPRGLSYAKGLNAFAEAYDRLGRATQPNNMTVFPSNNGTFAVSSPAWRAMAEIEKANGVKPPIYLIENFDDTGATVKVVDPTYYSPQSEEGNRLLTMPGAFGDFSSAEALGAHMRLASVLKEVKTSDWEGKANAMNELIAENPEGYLAKLYDSWGVAMLDTRFIAKISVVQMERMARLGNVAGVMAWTAFNDEMGYTDMNEAQAVFKKDFDELKKIALGDKAADEREDPSLYGLGNMMRAFGNMFEVTSPIGRNIPSSR